MRITHRHPKHPHPSNMPRKQDKTVRVSRTSWRDPGRKHTRHRGGRGRK